VELYQLLNQQAAQEGFELNQDVGGHRVGDFPHQKYSKASTDDLQFSPSKGLWVLEFQLVCREHSFGVFFEDLLI
jgi:hypothetical protein